MIHWRNWKGNPIFLTCVIGCGAVACSSQSRFESIESDGMNPSKAEKDSPKIEQTPVPEAPAGAPTPTPIPKPAATPQAAPQRATPMAAATPVPSTNPVPPSAPATSATPAPTTTPMATTTPPQPNVTKGSGSPNPWGKLAYGAGYSLAISTGDLADLTPNLHVFKLFASQELKQLSRTQSLAGEVAVEIGASFPHKLTPSKAHIQKTTAEFFKADANFLASYRFEVLRWLRLFAAGGPALQYRTLVVTNESRTASDDFSARIAFGGTLQTGVEISLFSLLAKPAWVRIFAGGSYGNSAKSARLSTNDKKVETNPLLPAFGMDLGWGIR